MYEETKYIRFSVISNAVVDAIAVVAIGIIGPIYINPNAPTEPSVLFSFISAWVLLGATVRSSRSFSYPPKPLQWFAVQAGWGCLWGIVPGMILGWGGGVMNYGLISWLAISIGFFAITNGLLGFGMAMKWARI